MYKKFKRMVMLVTLLLIVIIGIGFIRTYQSEMFAGQQQLIYVDYAQKEIIPELRQLARSHHVLIAKRISAGDDKGQLQNTYMRIGRGTLPSGMPAQRNNHLIRSSTNETIYVIVGKDLSARTLSERLNQNGNHSMIFSNNQSMRLVAFLFLMPQAAFGLLILLFAFAALVNAQYIAEIKNAGVKRLSGMSKHKIAFSQSRQDGIFLVTMVPIVVALTIMLLIYLKLFTLTYLLLILVPLVIMVVMFLLISISVSNFIFYFLQKQPIFLSIKGRAPLKAIAVMVAVFQILSLSASMYSLLALRTINQRISLLNQGQNAWREHRQYYGMVQVGDINAGNLKALNDFCHALYHDPANLYVDNNLSMHRNALDDNGSYFPTRNGGDNVLTVNSSFVSQSGIRFQGNRNPFFNRKFSNSGYYALLVPESQSRHFSDIKKQWSVRVQNMADSIAKHKTKTTVFASLYKSPTKLFAYRVFHRDDFSSADKSFAQDPIILVYHEETFPAALSDLTSIRVSDRRKVNSLIQHFHLENVIGTLVSGYDGVSQRLARVRTQKNALVLANLVSIFSSLLLIYLMNSLYLYQFRRKFFIEKIAGRGMAQIHSRYFTTVFLISFFAMLVADIAQMPVDIIIFPVVYLAILLCMFVIQARRSNKKSILYLKGE